MPLKGQVVPILRMFDVSKALDFYVGFLGFREDWRHQFEPDLPVYMQVSLDGTALHLSEHHGDGSPGSAIRIESDDLDAYCAALLAKKYRYYRPGIVETEWKTRELSVVDPFHNRIVFWAPV